MQVVSNRPRKANSWSCSFKQWHPRRLCYDCLSNSCRPVVPSRGGIPP